ncbi:hypothetical protein [Actinosynnema mirum]|uniref:Uncharacterized protein n=1 Tax=Actinosynnema mirum (strain ATCC 29888 / DSM 43827 / JCM 3225 / NBRC 14064 / NCIMB 13271 / NRRL B-12336 / IMRU 3971 / 101) TaxID=446462 RepID=C6WCY5_ACTMD|nr:hypothetical protein [Actinosynnema mirum]ACU37604.1 hypothetical protein Amir_3721 [Actinosynnema mirum DSM 43827]
MSAHHEVHRDGFFHSGTGDQHNYFHPVRPRRDPRLVARGQVDWLAARFAEPTGFPSGALDAPGSVVVLTAPVGARTAALMLLTGNGQLGGRRLRELSDGGDEDDPVLEAADLDAGDRLLLDLTGTAEERLRGLAPEVEKCWALVEGSGARLVVVVRDEQVRLLSSPLRQLLVTLPAPSARAVLAAHLRPEGIALPEPLPGDQAAYLGQASVHDAAELARLVLAACDAAPRRSAVEWLADAVVGWRNRGEQARALFADHVGGGERSLLVAASHLVGAPLEAVARADAALRRIAGVVAVEDPLHSPYLPRELAELGLEVRGRSLVFSSEPVAHAVREHFWTHFPTLHGALFEWVAEAAPAGGDDGVELVARFAEQALATGSAERLAGLTPGWAERNRPDLAYQALACGLADPRVGRAFRRHVYVQARSGRATPAYGRVLVAVCADEIARLRPWEALVRLHHLARHRDAQVRVEAASAVRALVAERRLERWLLHRLAHRMGALRAEDALLLGGLRVTGGSRATLVAVWRRLLGSAGVERLAADPLTAEVLAEWVGRDPGALVEACDLRIGLMDRLYLFTRRVSAEHAAALLEHVEAALGVAAGGGEL